MTRSSAVPWTSLTLVCIASIALFQNCAPPGVKATSAKVPTSLASTGSTVTVVGEAPAVVAAGNQTPAVVTGGDQAPAVVAAGDQQFVNYFRTNYLAIFGRSSTKAAQDYFLNSYKTNLIGCVATVRDLVKEDSLRANAAASTSNVQANREYVYKMYRVALGRPNLPGDDPEALISWRLAGADLASIDQVFYDHREFKNRCEVVFGLRMFPR